MLFPYIYVPHKIEKMQEFMDFIFYEVWCNAPVGEVFHSELFKGNLELKEIMIEFGFSKKAPKRGKKFYQDVKTIYELFAELTSVQIDQFKLWYQGNNDLEKVCANNPSIHLVRYDEIAVNHQQLAVQLELFFKGLYSDSLLNLKVLSNKIGDIKDHYKNFMSINKLGKCPFCGLSDLLGQHHEPREAYDHYLPKALYPFNSINFRNLVPTCHHCNSSYKTSKDPARSDQRRAIFYPYKTTVHSIEIQIEIQNSDFAKLTPADINLQFGPIAVKEELSTWIDVYSIEERYKAKLCSPDAKGWLEDFRILNHHHNITAEAHLQNIEVSNPFANSNFLKKAFMQACHSNGLLETFEKYV